METLWKKKTIKKMMKYLWNQKTKIINKKRIKKKQNYVKKRKFKNYPQKIKKSGKKS